MKLNDIKILSDENISPKVVLFLRNSGLDVLDVKEVGWHGETDSELLQKALETKRFILTHDSDFGTLAVNRGHPCFGIIYLRTKDLRSNNIIDVCKKLLNVNPDLSEGSILVVDERRLRIRHTI